MLLVDKETIEHEELEAAVRWPASGSEIGGPADQSAAQHASRQDSDDRPGFPGQGPPYTATC